MFVRVGLYQQDQHESWSMPPLTMAVDHLTSRPVHVLHKLQLAESSNACRSEQGEEKEKSLRFTLGAWKKQKCNEKLLVMSMHDSRHRLRLKRRKHDQERPTEKANPTNKNIRMNRKREWMHF